MALTYGFYNSLNGDRKYNAIQMSSIFDGIINDGILMNVGNRFSVTATGGLGIRVGSGRAWFNHTWTYNDSNMALTVKSADILLDRIDALVLEVDTRDESRMNSIRWVYGTPATIAKRPALIREPYINQYPLAYISVPRGTTNIQQANITNMIGTADTPYVTAPLEKIDISAQVAQWNNQWAILLASMESQKNQQKINWQAQMDILNAQYNEMLLLYHALETQSFVLINNNFDDWSVRRGCRKTTEFLSSGDILEKIVVISSNFLLAQKLTVFNSDGSILETVTFYPYEMKEETRTILTTSINISKLTRFNANGTITETIEGSANVNRLLDSTNAPLNDSSGDNLFVWE